jgi:isopenicillin-N epimerase
MIGSRRTFVGAFTYLPLAAATPSRLKQLLAVTPSGEGYWSMVAGQFPFRAGKIPMNAANLCPSPRVVSECVAELTRDEDSDISNPNRSKFNALADEARKKVAEHIGVSPDEIALVRNTSEANNVVNNGVQLAAGDEVVLWDPKPPVQQRRLGCASLPVWFQGEASDLADAHTVSRSDRETV